MDALPCLLDNIRLSNKSPDWRAGTPECSMHTGFCKGRCTSVTHNVYINSDVDLMNYVTLLNNIDYNSMDSW